MNLRLNEVQQAFIEKLKLYPALLAKLGATTEVREVEWQGTKFKYPNIRVRVAEFKRRESNPSCGLFDAVVQVYVFSDDASSLLINDIASDVFDILDLAAFTQSGVKVQGDPVRQGGAEWIEEGGVWRSEISLSCRVTKK